jgi:hypothetical protein
MSTIHPECPGSDPSCRLEAADALLRQEPDQGEEDDEEEDKGDGKEDDDEEEEEDEDEHDDNDDDKGDGYSERACLAG